MVVDGAVVTGRVVVVAMVAVAAEAGVVVVDAPTSPPQPARTSAASSSEAERRGITPASYRRVEVFPHRWYDAALPVSRKQSTMANIKSQQKRNRQNEVRRMRNKSISSELKTRAKRVEAAVTDGDLGAAEEALRKAQSKLDMAASRRAMHPRTAARRKARLAARVNRLRSE
jgi:small subunit ribosomal protein S20